MKRTELKRKTELSPGTKGLKRSWFNRKPVDPDAPKKPKKKKRTLSFDAEFDLAKPIVAERSQGRCEINAAPVCRHFANHYHHRRRRGITADGKANLPVNLMHCCFHCHDYAHTHPEWARAHGFIILTSDDPELVGWG